MEQSEAVFLLNGHGGGIAEWNRQRDAGESLPELSRVDLSGLDLTKANLSGMDLSFSLFYDCDLVETELRCANLRGAKLARALLLRTDLRHASLFGASLFMATILDAKLDGTDFEEAIFGFTNIAMCNLSRAKGLHEAFHQVTSNISVDTLLRFEDELPDTFLRRCGIQNEEIEHFRKRIKAGSRFYTVFISYAREDEEFVYLLHRMLTHRGVRCWFDERSSLPGSVVDAELRDAIRSSDRFLLCCSRHSARSEWVEREIIWALEKERDLQACGNTGATILIPLALDRYVFRVAPSENARWASLRSRVINDFTDGAFFPSIIDAADETFGSAPSRNFAVIESAVEKLVESLRRELISSGHFDA